MDDHCIEWRGAKDENGYGIRLYLGKKHRAHRAAFHEAHGYWPNVCRHTCDNPPCFNVAHLVDGTHADNMRDKVDRGRQPRGQDAGKAKLTDEDVRQIRALLDAGASGSRLAEDYGVSRQAISYIKLRRNWTHI